MPSGRYLTPPRGNATPPRCAARAAAEAARAAAAAAARVSAVGARASAASAAAWAAATSSLQADVLGTVADDFGYSSPELRAPDLRGLGHACSLPDQNLLADVPPLPQHLASLRTAAQPTAAEEAERRYISAAATAEADRRIATAAAEGCFVAAKRRRSRNSGQERRTWSTFVDLRRLRAAAHGGTTSSSCISSADAASASSRSSTPVDDSPPVPAPPAQVTTPPRARSLRTAAASEEEWKTAAPIIGDAAPATARPMVDRLTDVQPRTPARFTARARSRQSARCTCHNLEERSDGEGVFAGFSVARGSDARESAEVFVRHSGWNDQCFTGGSEQQHGDDAGAGRTPLRRRGLAATSSSLPLPQPTPAPAASSTSGEPSAPQRGSSLAAGPAIPVAGQPCVFVVPSGAGQAQDYQTMTWFVPPQRGGSSNSSQQLPMQLPAAPSVPYPSFAAMPSNSRSQHIARSASQPSIHVPVRPPGNLEGVVAAAPPAAPEDFALPAPFSGTAHRLDGARVPKPTRPVAASSSAQDASSFFLEAERTMQEAERIACEELSRKAREEAERKAWEESQQREREETARKAKQESERLAREEFDRKTHDEADRKAWEEVQQQAREVAVRKVSEDVERIAREELERKALDDAERKAWEEAQQRAKEAAEQRLREVSEKAREEAARKVWEEAERQAIEDVERRAQEDVARKAREDAERREWEQETDRRVREEATRMIKMREEAERKAWEDFDQRLREDAERRSRLEVQRKAMEEEADRRVQEETQRRLRIREEAEKRAWEEAERVFKEEAERKALEIQRRLQDEADRRVAEEAKQMKQQQEDEERRARVEADLRGRAKASSVNHPRRRTWAGPTLLQAGRRSPEWDCSNEASMARPTKCEQLSKVDDPSESSSFVADAAAEYSNDALQPGDHASADVIEDGHRSSGQRGAGAAEDARAISRRRRGVRTDDEEPPWPQVRWGHRRRDSPMSPTSPSSGTEQQAWPATENVPMLPDAAVSPKTNSEYQSPSLQSPSLEDLQHRTTSVREESSLASAQEYANKMFNNGQDNSQHQSRRGNTTGRSATPKGRTASVGGLLQAVTKMNQAKQRAVRACGPKRNELTPPKEAGGAESSSNTSMQPVVRAVLQKRRSALLEVPANAPS